MRGPILPHHILIFVGERKKTNVRTYLAAIFGAKNESRKFQILVDSVCVGIKQERVI
jgi:hypothetical protein